MLLNLYFSTLCFLNHCLSFSPFSFGHCIVCPSSIYGFWLPFGILAIVLSVLHRFTASDYPLVYWPLYCLSFIALRLLTTLWYIGHCIVCPSSLYGFWLPFGILAIVLSVLHRFTASDYPLVSWPLYCLSFIALRLLTTLWYLGHCIVCPSSLYGFWLPFGILAIVLSVLHRFTASDYPLVSWPLYCLSFIALRLLTTLWYLGHCIVCPSSLYGFRLPFGILAIVLSVLHRFTASDYPLVSWPLYCLSFIDLRFPTTLWYLGHCIVCPSSLYGFWLPFGILAIVLSVLHRSTFPTTLWYLGHCIVCPSSLYGFWLPFGILAIVLSVLHRFTASDYPLVSWPLYCLSFVALRLLTTLWYLGHCIVCPSSLYGFWLPFGILAIVLSVLHRFTASDYPLVSWPLYCLSFIALRLLTTLWYLGHCIVCPSSLYGFWLPFGILAIVLSVLHRFTVSDYPLVSWPLYCLSFIALRLLTTLWYLGHCIVCPSSIYGFDYPLVSWPLYCLSFIALRLLTTLWYLGHCIVCPSSLYGFWLPFGILAIVLSVLHRFTVSTTLWYLGHCIVCPSSLYGFWLPFGILAIALSVLHRFTASDYPLVSWPLYCLSFIALRFPTTLWYLGHCIVCPSSIYGFWLPFGILAIVLYVLHRFTASDYPLVSWPLYCLSFIALRLLTTLWYLGHCIVCPSSLYGFWLPFGILAIVLSVLHRFTASDYPLVSWPLYCLSFIALRLLTTLWYLGHCIVCPSSIYGFWLPFGILAIVLSVLHRFTVSTTLWYLGHCIVCPSSLYGFWLPFGILAIALSVLHRFTASDCPLVSWPLYCLSFIALRLLTTLWYLGHCIVCPSSLYGFWLPFGILAIVLSVLHRFTASDYPLVSWPLYCLSFIDLRLLTTLWYLGNCIVCPSSLYGFWLPFGILAIVLSVLHRFTASDYPLVSWPLYCLSFIALRLLTTLWYLGHCIVCPSSIYGFWLPFGILAIVLSVLHRFTASDYPLVSWPLYCLSFIDLRLLTTLWYLGHCAVCPVIYGFWLPFGILAIVLSVLWFTASDYPLVSWPLYCLSCDLRFWLPFGILAIVLSVLHRFTASDYPLVSWPLYCLSCDLRLLTTLWYLGHCVVCPVIYGFWLPFGILATVLSVLWFTASDYPLVSWPLCCLSCDLRLLITFWYLGHCIVCPVIYGFWLPFGILVIVLSVLWFTASDYPLVSWPLCCLSCDLRLLITFWYLGHCIVCPVIYGFWLPFGILVIVLSVLWFTASDYPLVSWPLCCLSCDLRLLTTLWYLGHSVVCPVIYGFWLPFGILAIVLSVLWFMASDYPLVSWPLCCLSCDLRLLITLWYLLTFLLSRLRWWETMTDSTHRLKAHLTVCHAINKTDWLFVRSTYRTNIATTLYIRPLYCACLLTSTSIGFFITKLIQAQRI